MIETRLITDQLVDTEPSRDKFSDRIAVDACHGGGWCGRMNVCGVSCRQ